MGVMQPLSRSQSIQQLFMMLMSKQPPHYRLAANTLSTASSADPTNLLSWVRGYPLDMPPRYIAQRDFAEALLA
jgi:hypothetical protein